MSTNVNDYEFVVKSVTGQHEVWLVQKITGELIEKYGLYDTEEKAEEAAEALWNWYQAKAS